MRWIHARRIQATLGAGLLLFCTLLLCVADPERQLTVYTPQRTYSVAVQDRQGQLYVSLLDLVQPLGSASLNAKGEEWKLRFDNNDAVFTVGSDRAKIRGKQIDLNGQATAENNQLMVPLSSSFPILSALLKKPVELHLAARRLFIDDAATHFTAELKKTEKSSLLLNFDHPVSPTVTQEENKIKLTFKREPLVSDLIHQPWDDKTIHSMSFSEDNGIAFLTVDGASGISASVANDGRSVLIQGPPVAAANPPPPASQEGSSALASSVTSSASQTQPPHPWSEAETRAPAFFVMIDPGHGGDDQGAALGEKLVEKDVTVALARKLKSELQERGIAAHLLRDGDVSISLEQRAETTNEQHAGIYVAIHAGLPGHGVRVYAPGFTSGVPSNSAKFLTWENAQANYLVRSRALAHEIAANLEKKNVQVSSLNTPLRPLNNINAPAVAVELALNPDNIPEVTSQKFQTTVAAGVAAGIVQLRAEQEGKR